MRCRLAPGFLGAGSSEVGGLSTSLGSGHGCTTPPQLLVEPSGILFVRGRGSRCKLVPLVQLSPMGDDGSVQCLLGRGSSLSRSGASDDVRMGDTPPEGDRD